MRHIVFGGLMFAMLLSTACSETPATAKIEPAKAPLEAVPAKPQGVLVRLVSANPQGVNLVSGSDVIMGNVAYGKTTGYKDAGQGITLSLQTASDGEALSSGHRELIAGKHYTVVALPREQGAVSLPILSDDPGTLAPDTAGVRLVNATFNKATRAAEDMDLSRAGTKELILHGMAAGEGTGVVYVNVAKGPLEVRSSSQPGRPLIAKLNVEPGHFYTFIVVGADGSWDVIQIVETTG